MKWKTILPHSFLIFLVPTIFLSLSSSAQSMGKFTRENTEWCNIWISHTNENNLPKVLLIGNSITRSYFSEVSKRFEGKANVCEFVSSYFLSDPMLLSQLGALLDNVNFDVIHFNNGMHGWQFSEEEYKKAFPGFLEVIQKHSHGAQLIWATTTPFKIGDVPDVTNARVTARNAIAFEFIKSRDIAIDDLNTLMIQHTDLHTDNVHFNQQGVVMLADKVTAAITDALISRKKLLK